MILVRILDYPKISELLASLTPQEIKYEFIRMYIRTNAYIQPYAYTLPHFMYILPNAYIRPYACTLSHISYIHDITRNYDLTRTYGLPIFRSSHLVRKLCIKSESGDIKNQIHK